MKLNPYLTFNGNAKRPSRPTQKVLGGEIIAMMTHRGHAGRSACAAEWRDKIIHARLVSVTMC